MLNISTKKINLTMIQKGPLRSVDPGFSVFREEAIHKKIPAAFVGTQSAKNPNWDKDPENRDKSTIFVATGVPYDWFKDFEGTKLLHRGDE